MEWLGLDWDDGSVRHTERFDLHRDAGERLLAAGHAYRCRCTPIEIEGRRQRATASGQHTGYDRTRRELAPAPDNRTSYVPRFRTPVDGETVVVDEVQGRVVFQNPELDDFAHIPLILGLDKSRLSRRHGATSVMQHHDDGYLPPAMVNFLARQGWSHGDQALFTRAKLIDHFSRENVGISVAIFNPATLVWTNFQSMKATPAAEHSRGAVSRRARPSRPHRYWPGPRTPSRPYASVPKRCSS